mmetsp:Transcript_50061/g.106534  ORF Transcript_50061/g.106534 Transcript_50061/m.106534 type:complete len:80 (+) Transcript_50061:1056-1295(+)
MHCFLDAFERDRGGVNTGARLRDIIKGNLVQRRRRRRRRGRWGNGGDGPGGAATAAMDRGGQKVNRRCPGKDARAARRD